MVAAMAALLLSGARLVAQNVFVAEYKGKMLPVAKMLNAHPYVVDGDQLVPADGDARAFVKGGEYLPIFVTISGLDVQTRGLTEASEHSFNDELRVHVTFTSPYHLENAFFVFDLKTRKGDKFLFAYEIGTIEPRVPKKVALSLPLKEAPGEGQFFTHVFTEGREVLNSRMDPLARDMALDAMIAKAIENKLVANPEPFVGPEPEYPQALWTTKRTGRAVVTIRIGTNGAIRDPVVKEATDPEFGTAAVEAVQEWRFLPKVKDGHPVECKVNMPFNFAPPAEGAEKG